MSQRVVLSLRDLVVDYVSRYQVVNAVGGLSFDVSAGEFVSVVGPSGCGKTTMLRAIAGLLGVTAGEIKLTHSVDRTPTAMVFQAPSLFPWRTVIKNVMYGAQSLRGGQRRTARERASTALNIVGLSENANDYPGQLSGGMQQRVNLARALAVDPELILLDEPFASLDAQTREVMQGELAAIWARTQTSAVLITHQVDEAVFLADRVLVFSPRPATIRDVVEIDLPRPRRLDMKRSSEFGSYVDRIWAQLKSDADSDRREAESLFYSPAGDSGAPESIPGSVS